MRCRRRLALLALLLGACAPAREAPSPSLCMPDDIGGLLVRVDRKAEAARALALMDRLAGRDLRDPVAAVYEFYMFRDKPLFYVVLGTGSAGPAALLEDALDAFGATAEPAQPRVEDTRDGIAFRCVDFARGPGLVGISGACAFQDGERSGYGVRTDGGDSSDALKFTAEARASYLTRRAAARAPCSDVPHLAARAAPSTDRDEVAREIVAAILSGHCARIRPFLAAGSEELFRERVPPVLAERRDPVEWVCFVLGTVGYPQSEAMRIAVESESERRVVLRLSSRGEEADLALVPEDGTWKIDGAWALAKVYDHRTKLSVAQLASSLGSTRRNGRYTDDPAEMRRRNHVVPPPMRAGLPTRASGPGELHLALGNDGRAACVSARSWSGAYFLARLDDTGAWSTARFTEPPRQCPSRPVGDRW